MVTFQQVDNHEETGTESCDPVVGTPWLVGVFLTVLGLGAIAVVVSRRDLGDLGILGDFTVCIVLGIAMVQATLVALFFMRPSWENPFHRVILLGTVIFATVFLALCTIDIRDHGGTLDTTSPLVQEKLDQGRQSLADRNN